MTKYCYVCNICYILKLSQKLSLFLSQIINDGACVLGSSQGRNFQYIIYLMLFIFNNQLLYKQTFYEINPPEFEP